MTDSSRPYPHPLISLARDGDAKALSAALEKLSAEGAASPELLAAALIYACEEGSAERCALLVEAGAPTYRERVSTATALTVACAGGYLECAELLIQAGADLEQPNLLGRRPLSFAVAHPALIRLLLEAGADPNALDAESGSSALAQCFIGYEEDADSRHQSAEILLAAGADPLLKDHQSDNALAVALLFKDQRGAAMLRSAIERAELGLSALSPGSPPPRCAKPAL